MKVQLTFKTPDVADQLSKEEMQEFGTLIRKFVKYNEYVTIEFDSETQTVSVVDISL